jgi:endopolyphosphatase
VDVKGHKGLDKVLLKDFSGLPEDVDYGDYSVINVSPSVVPTYFPSLRVFTYNVSAEAVQEALERKERRRQGVTVWKRPPPHGHRKPDPGKPRADQCKRKKYRDSWRCHFSKDSWHSDPEAPSRKNGLMSPLGFAQVSLEPVDLFFSVANFLRFGWRFCVPGVHHFPNRSLRMWCKRLSFIFRSHRP